MKKQEDRIVEILSKLREEYGANCLKLSFESENLGMYELMKAKEIATRAGVGILMKLGGCEASADAMISKDLGAEVILGPMIETKFAMGKYLEMCEKVFKDYDEGMEFWVNIETVESCEKIEEILSAKNIEKLDGIVVGRTDLTKSMEGNPAVNDKEVLDLVKTLFEKTQAKGVKCMLGGGISAKAEPFFNELGDLLDGYETRKVVFKSKEGPSKDIKACLDLALEFELEWYNMKKAHYGKRESEDDGKIKQMKDALGL